MDLAASAEVGHVTFFYFKTFGDLVKPGAAVGEDNELAAFLEETR